MIWLSTSASSCRASPLLLMDGCNPMDLVVSSHQSSMVMWAAQRQWLSSGQLLLRALPSAQWRECLLALSPFSIGPSLELTSLGINSIPPYNITGKVQHRELNKEMISIHIIYLAFLTLYVNLFADLRPATRLLWLLRMKLKTLRKVVLVSSKLMRLLWERDYHWGSPSTLTTWTGLSTPSESPMSVFRTPLRYVWLTSDCYNFFPSLFAYML